MGPEAAPADGADTADAEEVGAPEEIEDEVGGPADEANDCDEGGGWMVGVVRLVPDAASSPSKVLRPPRDARDPDPPVFIIKNKKKKNHSGFVQTLN